ncbi:NmrA family NAD(P)-binding protein [Amycolatopsis thermoflava]|uniref:NmrA family NAD(P)-binding protein n=1 Tax=Amycolatopsis thermoflava TaxID=84480 RepID=UPI0036672AB9
MNELVLVTGATGQQGGAVARRLLADGWRVRALTRDPARARDLAAAGAEVVRGDLEDEASVAAAVAGAYGVFSVHPGPLAPGQDEVRAGKLLVDVARRAGVRRLVYSSALAADVFQAAKWEVEQYLAASGMPYTILRPSSFMENYLNPLFGLRDGALRTALAPHVRQQLIALDDIAAFAADGFAGRLDGRTLTLAGDALTPSEVAAAISAAIGVTVPYEQLPIDELRRVNPRFAQGYEYLNNNPEPPVDIAALRALQPVLMTFAQWLERTGSAQLKAGFGAAKKNLRPSQK